MYIKWTPKQLYEGNDNSQHVPEILGSSRYNICKQFHLHSAHILGKTGKKWHKKLATTLLFHQREIHPNRTWPPMVMSKNTTGFEEFDVSAILLSAQPQSPEPARSRPIARYPKRGIPERRIFVSTQAQTNQGKALRLLESVLKRSSAQAKQ